LIDGRPYHDQTLAEVRGRIALVEQDNPVLHGSLRDNVMMGRPTATDAEIWTVLEQVNLADTIKELSRRLDANVLDRAHRLHTQTVDGWLPPALPVTNSRNWSRIQSSRTACCA
jgi:ATP-binding cassette subfamily B protein